MTRIFKQHHVEAEKVVDEVGVEYGPVFAVAEGVVEDFLYKEGLFYTGSGFIRSDGTPMDYVLHVPETLDRKR